MILMLQPIVERGFETDTDRLLLGFAHTRLGQWEQAIFYFQQVSGRLHLERERIIHCNTFAYALARTGRLAEAQAHVRRFTRDTWPVQQRQWGDQLVSGSGSGIPAENIAPPRLFH